MFFYSTTILKKRLYILNKRQSCFFVNSAKFLWTPTFFQNNSGRLLLYIVRNFINILKYIKSSQYFNFGSTLFQRCELRSMRRWKWNKIWRRIFNVVLRCTVLIQRRCPTTLFQRRSNHVSTLSNVVSPLFPFWYDII